MENTTPNDVAGGITPGAFVNGFEINVIPKPASASLSLLAGLGVILAGRWRD